MTYVIMCEGEEYERVDTLDEVRDFFERATKGFYEDKAAYPEYYGEDDEPYYGEYEVLQLVKEIGVPSYDEEMATRYRS